MSEVAVMRLPSSAPAPGARRSPSRRRAPGASVTLWARDPDRAAAMARSRENPRLPGIALPDAVAVVTGALPDAALVLLAVPMQHLRAVAGALRGRGAILCCAKGVEAGTLALPLEILAALHPRRPPAC